MSYYFGLYFGNTNLCLAVHREDKFEVLANAAGDRVTPACVSFANGEKLVGLAAKQALVRYPTNTITNIKSLLGGDSSAVERCKCKVIEDDGYKYVIETDGKVTRIEPSETLTSLFKIMAIISKSHCHEADIPAVVTVPLSFTQEQRNVVRKCAVDAGFRLLRVVSEPAAAALAYDIGQKEESPQTHCVVYRMGGTTIDVTIIRVIASMYHVVGSVTKHDCGGNLFTEQLASFCASEFRRQYKVDISENKRSIIKLHAASEVCKHILSSIGSAQCFAESIYDGIDLSINVSRARFESLIGSVLQLCTEPIQEALKSANLSAAEIDKVILAGGSCKIPKLQQVISEMFPSSTVLSNISPDEVIAIGAAKQAHIIQEEKEIAEEDCYIDVLTYAICAKIVCHEKTSSITMFPKGTLIPAFHCQSLSFDSPVSYVDIYEQTAEAGDTSAIDYLVRLTSPVPSMKNFTITMNLSQEGILEVVCSDNVSLAKKSATIMPPN